MMNPKSSRFALFAVFLVVAGLLPNDSLALKSTGVQRLAKDISPITGWDDQEYPRVAAAPKEKRASKALHEWSNWAGNQ
ncbi:hypothetical protein BGZ80_005001, partial [Entomortierella chlamydospora]